MTSLIVFDHATLGYGRRVVLSDISFDIPAGDFLGLVGPNGAGKTTILRAILGSLAPLSGTVTEVNQAVIEAPELVNDDPYGQGWLIRVRLSEPTELDDLLDATAYAAHLKGL